MTKKLISFASLSGALAAVAVASALMTGCGGSYNGASAVYGGPGNSPSPTPQGVPLQTASLKGSPGFVNGSGHTVYVFDADLQSPGRSVCNGPCAQNWPPMIAPPGTLPAPDASIVRQDGRNQLTYKGRPMYTFAGDGAPGQTNGDGLNAFGGIWHIARP